MREKLNYSLHGKNEDKERVYQILYRKPNPYPVYTIDDIYADSDQHKVLLKACETHNVKLTKSNYFLEFTKQELEAAEFLELFVVNLCPCSSKNSGTIYTNDTACKHCNLGETLVSEYKIDKTLMRKKLIASTYDEDIIIDKKLYDMLNENGFTGLKFINVKHKNDKLKDEIIYYKLDSSNILPPLNQDKSEFLFDGSCDYCNKKGRLMRSPFYYDRSSLRDAKDFNYTNEYFGTGLISKQGFIVTQRVYKFFTENKIRGVKFNAVFIVD